MLSERSHFSVRRLVAVIGGLLIAALLAPTTALAGDGSSADSRALLTYLPSNSRFAARVDVDSLRESKYFDEALEYVEDQSDRADDELAEMVDTDLGEDLRSSVNTIAVGLPASRVDASGQADKRTFALAGDFDSDDIEAAAQEYDGDIETLEHNGLTVYRQDDSEFALVTPDRLVVTKGPKSYRNSVWSLAVDGGNSFQNTADDHDLLAGLDTSRTVWMVNRLKGADHRASSKIDSAAISLALETGVDLQVLTRAASEADANAFLQQIEAMKKSASENAMVTMFGAAPLVGNLSVKRDGTTVIATTSMTESEFDVLVDKVRQFAGSSSQMSIPSSGSSDDDSESSETSKTPKEDTEKN